MTFPSDVVSLAVLVTLPAIGTLIASGLSSPKSSRFAARSLTSCYWLAAGLAVWMVVRTDAAPVDWNAGTWLSVPGRVAWNAHWWWRAEPVRLWWVAGILGLAALTVTGPMRDSQGSGSRWHLLCFGTAHAACAAQWLAAELWLMLLLHAVVGVATFCALGAGSVRPTAGPAARKWLVTSFVGDAFLLAVIVVLLPLVDVGSNWNSSTVLAQVGERLPPLPGVIAAALVLGSLARAALWPFNDWMHEVTEGPDPRATLLVATAAWPSGLCWLVLAGPWLTETPAAQLVAAGLGLLTAVTAPFFALSQASPRRMAGWLLAGNSGLLVAALALSPEFAGASGLAGLGLMGAGVLLWRRVEGVDAGTIPELRLARQPTSGQGFSNWTTSILALCPAVMFVAGPLLLNVAGQEVNWLPYAPSVTSQSLKAGPVLPGMAVAGALGIAIALQGAAAVLLARRSAVRARGDQAAWILVLPGMAALFPLAWLRLSAIPAGGWTPLLVSSGMIAGAVLLGAVAAILLRPFVAKGAAGWDSLSRLSRQRLHLDGAVFLLVNVPVRALAQLGRFCEWFVLDGLFYGELARMPVRAGRELRRLQTGQPSFYALAAVLITGALLMTLLQIRP